MSSINTQNFGRLPLKVFGASVLYVLLAQVSLTYFSLDGSIRVIWFPAGLALAMLLMFGNCYAWSAFFGQTLFNMLQGWEVGLAFAVGTSSTLSTLLSAWLITRQTRFDISLSSVNDYFRLIFMSGAASLLGATAETLSLLRYGLLNPVDIQEVLTSWWTGDLIGILLLTPLLLIWRHPPVNTFGKYRQAKICIFLGFTFLFAQAATVRGFGDSLNQIAQGYWPFVLVAASTLWLRRHGLALLLLMAAVQAWVRVHHDISNFSGTVSQMHLVGYWLYVVSLTCFGMMGAIYFDQLKQAQFELVEREHSYHRQFADNTAIMLLFDPEGRVLEANKAALRFYRYECSQFQSMSLSDVSCRTPQEIQEILASETQVHGTQFESQHRLADGALRDVSVSTSLILLGNRRVIHAIVFDITARKRAEDEIEKLAFFDQLTGLPNRRMLLDRLQQALKDCAIGPGQGALLFIDLDNFNTINDTHGHDKGDLLLHQVAQRLCTFVRQGDIVARLGGDEFVIMIIGLSNDPTDAVSQVEDVGYKVLAALKRPYELGGIEYHGSASMGISFFGGREDSVGELLKRADMALYQAKSLGRNTLHFFEPAMQAARVERASLEADLRQSILREQFVLYYQAQVNELGKLTGAEVLVRWQHPQRGIVSPVEFIGLAEETGLIVALGHWVLKTSCMQLATWAGDIATAHLTLSVNVSARQFHQKGFVEEVLDLVRQTGAPAGLLKLELTESMLIDNVDSTVAKMTELKAQGIGFSLDDFGTGYSSLSYLKRLPLNQLKIDQTFVRDALTDPNSGAIVKTIVALGQSLGLTVIAEGVETKAQANFLLQNGCYAYQGYLFGRPGPMDALKTLS